MVRGSENLPMRPSLRQGRVLGTGSGTAKKPILGGDKSTWSPRTDNVGDGDNAGDNGSDAYYTLDNAVDQLMEKPKGFYSQNNEAGDGGNGNGNAGVDDGVSSKSTGDDGNSTFFDGGDTSTVPSMETSSAPSPGVTTADTTNTTTSKDSGSGNPPGTSAPTPSKLTPFPTSAPKLPTPYPTKNPTLMPSPMPTTEAWGDKVKDEEEKIKQLASDKTAEAVAGIIAFLGIIGMLTTAYNLFENPDGMCAMFCRLSLKFTSFIMKVVCLPCRLCCGKYSGYTSSDPKNRTLFVEEYTNDLELT